MTESTPTAPPARAKAVVLLRLLALLYDLFPMLGVWFLIGVLSLALHGGEAIRGGLAGGLEFVALLAATGLYATASWRRGGQTLGMRPWRLKVVAADGSAPGWRALWLRYAAGTLSLALAGLGFWWAWFDRDRLAWHDRLSGTRIVRLEKR